MGEDQAITPPAHGGSAQPAGSRARRGTQSKALYERLRPGPHGSARSREQVIRHQRARLLGAMIEAVSERGYGRVSVQQIVTLAGVSKRTFYEHFASKEDCFLATFEEINLDAMRRLAAVYAEQEDRDARLRMVLGWVLSNVAQRPKEARLRMVEAFAAGPSAHARVRQMRARIEAVIAASLPRRAENPPPIAVKGMAHGLWHLLCSRLLKGSVAELPGLAEDLYGWMACYRCPARALPPAPRLAARSPVLARPFQPPRGDERRRLQHAALHLVGHRGWLALTRPALLELAEVEDSAFCALYGDAEDCFMEALDLLAAEALAPMLSAARSAGSSWPAIVQAAMGALVKVLAEDPVFARAAFVESSCAGPRGVERGGRLLDGFAALLRRYAPARCGLSATASQATAGAVWGILHDYVHAGASDRLGELAPQLSYVVLAPTVGARAAIESIAGLSPAEPLRGVDARARRAA
jgi:AcrR family transcriptional regulator